MDEDEWRAKLQEEIDEVKRSKPISTVYGGFETTKFIGYAKAPFKMNRNGEYEFTMAVNFEFREQAHILETVMEMPVIITVERLNGLTLMDDVTFAGLNEVNNG